VVTVGTPSWYAWLESATTFTFECSEGRFTAHKVRAGNRRGGWYWRAYRRKLGRLSRCYLGVSANLTLPRLCEAAHRLASRAESTSTRKAAEEPGHESQTMTSSAVLTPILILNTKFALPRLPVQHVSRPHLLALAEQGVQRPVMLVSAPAGSGKTTLLAEWAATTTLSVAWLSCESADNDPARFLSYLLAALSRLDERITRADQVDLFWYAHDHERVLTGPLNDLARLLQQDAVVILDDYHLITTDTVHAALHFLLDHLPARLHLVIGTRVDPPLPLARLRARNQVSELRMGELRFGAPEVEAFVRTMGLTLSGEALSLLEERTEGWIAGIQLLALVLSGHADAAAFLRATGFTHRFLLDYVSEEVLAQQTPEVQRFLLWTCVLDRLTGPLCDAITGEPGGQERLAAALRANLFLSALDDTQTWYRYHPIFAEALRAHLHQRSPDLVPELYRRASSWYEQQHREEEACEYALLAGDQPRAATLLEDLIPHLLEQGKVLHMRTLLSQLSSALVEASPTLWAASVLLPMLRRGIQGTDTQTMASIIEQIEQQIQAHAQEGESAWAELQAGLSIVQAIAALAHGDSARALSLALDTEPSPARSGRALSRFIDLGKRGLLGAAYGASGDLAAAEQLFFAAPSSGSTSADQPRNLSVAASLAELYEAHGQLRKLGQFYDELFQELAQRADASPLLSALMRARYALLWYEWNRLTEAERATSLGMEMAERLDVPLASLVSLLGLWTQGRLALAQGDGEQARHLLERAAFTMTTLQVAEQEKRLLGAIPARLALACGQLEPALRWVETCGLHFDDSISPAFRPAGNGYLAYSTLARILLAHGRDPRNGSRLAQAALLLERLHNLTAQKGWQGRSREIEMLMALVLQAQGKSKRALLTLGSVLAQAEPEGYVRLFADEGPPMAQLLAQITAYTTASPGYIKLLQAACAPMQPGSGGPALTAARQPLLDPLSPREREVLQLVAAGFSNQQIADRLVISLNTAKRHVKHVLAKLTVANRTQAVVRARELHLL
jgi:LuxR family transcriptional regulator, maltose regulon positive regulatory protein